jgi:cytochrome c oxidase cbb3-type subunit III
MADFINEWLGTLVAVVVVLSILACALLLWSQSVLKVKLGADGKPLPPESTGHVWDGDLTENNTPLPGWWKTLFYVTIVFGFGYLVLFGVADVKGTLGWSEVGEYEKEMAAGEAQYGPIFSKYLAMDIKAVAKDPDAQEIGQRLFLTTCSQCHGSDAQGGKGYPNLTDKDWLYGGEPETIVKTLHEGRNGVMPPMGAVVGSEDDIRNVANYVLSLSGTAHDPVKAALGKPKFAACAACHGADGKGNQALGSANLTDKIWLYGGDINTIKCLCSKIV